MRKMKLLVAFVVTLGLTVGLAGMASAASISCGQCHGTYDNGTNATTNNPVDRRTTGAEPGWESSLIPTQDNGVRGLHGIHMNYSSATYGVVTTNQLVGTSRYSSRGNCSYCHNGHPRHATGYVNFTTTAAISKKPRQTVTQPLLGNKYLLSYTSAGRGVSYKNNIPSLVNNPTGNCTQACHKGTSQSNQAPWGNYNDVSIKLSCSSCHMDGSNINTISVFANGSGINGYVAGYTLSSPPHVRTAYDAPKLKGHATHLNGDWQGTKIVLGNYSGTLQGGPSGHSPDYACQLCHPNNTDEGGTPAIRANDGTLTIATNDFASYDQNTGKLYKAYPHASDGTNVIATNAMISGLAGIQLNDPVHPYNSTTAANGKFGCTNACHANFNTTTYGVLVAGKGTLTWDDTGASHCDSCHNHTASSGVNNASNVQLSFGHSLHFDMISTTHTGSGTRGLPSCNDCHLGAHTNYAGVATITQLPVLQGAAGLVAGINYSAAGTISVAGTCAPTCHTQTEGAWNSIGTGTTIATTGCATCHNYPGALSADGTAIKDWAPSSNNGHTIRYASATRKAVTTALGYYSTITPTISTTYNSSIDVTHLNNTQQYNYLTDTYAGVTGDSTKCGKCHSGGTHASKKPYANVNAGTGNAAGFSLTTTFINGQGHVAQCNNAMCHFNRKTPNWY